MRCPSCNGIYRDPTKPGAHSCYESVCAERDRLRAALKGVISAWNGLPGGQRHTAVVVERWLGQSMKPAIDAARETDCMIAQDSEKAVILSSCGN